MLVLLHIEKEQSAWVEANRTEPPVSSIEWCTNGRGDSSDNVVVMYDPERLVKELLPQFAFAPTTPSSFERKLARWGFRQVSSRYRGQQTYGSRPHTSLMYQCDHFRKGDFARLRRMQSNTAEKRRCQEAASIAAAISCSGRPADTSTRKRSPTTQSEGATEAKRSRARLDATNKWMAAQQVSRQVHASARSPSIRPSVTIPSRSPPFLGLQEPVSESASLARSWINPTMQLRAPASAQSWLNTSQTFQEPVPALRSALNELFGAERNEVQAINYFPMLQYSVFGTSSSTNEPQTNSPLLLETVRNSFSAQLSLDDTSQLLAVLLRRQGSANPFWGVAGPGVIEPPGITNPTRLRQASRLFPATGSEFYPSSRYSLQRVLQQLGCMTTPDWSVLSTTSQQEVAQSMSPDLIIQALIHLLRGAQHQY
jgi:HSF-type DNA-binding